MGTDKPSADIQPDSLSSQPPGWLAAMSPAGMPKMSARSADTAMSSSVRGRRRMISEATGVPSVRLSPKSPRKRPTKRSAYWTGKGLSSPSWEWISATSEGSGAIPPCDSRISAGSPGTMRIARKTMLATIQIRMTDTPIRRRNHVMAAHSYRETAGELAVPMMPAEAPLLDASGADFAAQAMAVVSSVMPEKNVSWLGRFTKPSTAVFIA
ncbi:hypothetical protein CHELA20_10481 [Hyphomicrobiales bacterium]|nr:hypothetical protein CHELA20_10481 [Hyphomicrobiales bacterium]CAH1692404.1 hypothetical protein CHELA41_50708 [Hyphomicrobiales bacterium]